MSMSDSKFNAISKTASVLYNSVKILWMITHGSKLDMCSGVSRLSGLVEHTAAKAEEQKKKKN